MELGPCCLARAIVIGDSSCYLKAKHGGLCLLRSALDVLIVNVERLLAFFFSSLPYVLPLRQAIKVS